MHLYECIKQDTFNKLKVNKIYKIKDNIVYNDAENIALYRLTTYQLEKMFRKVTSDKN